MNWQWLVTFVFFFFSAELFVGGRHRFHVSLVSGRVKGGAGKKKQDPGIVKESCFVSACPVCIQLCSGCPVSLCTELMLMCLQCMGKGYRHQTHDIIHTMLFWQQLIQNRVSPCGEQRLCRLRLPLLSKTMIKECKTLGCNHHKHVIFFILYMNSN